MSQRIPAEVFPPSEFLRDEMEARGWSVEQLAEKLRQPLSFVVAILTDASPITPETAAALGEAFEVDPQIWLNLDQVYRANPGPGDPGRVVMNETLSSSG